MDQYQQPARRQIESLYARDPDKYTYWPIFQYNLDANPLLENYSWY